MAFQTPQPPSTIDDPTATYLGASTFEFLLVELVPLAYRISAELVAKENAFLGKTEASETSVEELSKGFGVGGIGGTVVGRDEEETRESVHFRLDRMGYRVGQGLVER
jgi:hypothetical protein